MAGNDARGDSKTEARTQARTESGTAVPQQEAPNPGFTLADAVGTLLGEEPATVQDEEQVLVPFTERNDVAVVPGDQARQVITELERSGVEGHRISFMRLDAPSLSHVLDATPAPDPDPGPIGQRDELSVVAGAAVCGLVGAVLAGVVVLILADGAAALWAALGGLLLGGALGALWAVFRRLGASHAWERSLHTEPGACSVIGVHLDDPAGDESVTRTLGRYGLWVFRRDGSVVHRPNRAA